MKKLWKTYKRSLYSKAEFYQKREDLYNIDTLFICYFGYNCLYIINLILSLVIDHRSSQDYVQTFIPIGLILIFLSIIYCLKRKVFTFSFEKEQYQKYIFYFDLLKGIMYIILAVIIVEGKLLQISKENEPKSYHDGYWLSSELGLISLPVILSIQTCSVKLSLIVFQYLYSFLRMQGWNDEYIDGIFLLVKTLPIMFCLYRFYLFEDKLRIDKSRQAEDRKFASTVLDLLPEGVAIVDEEGLKYHNNSLRAILHVKDSQCLEALSALQNNDFHMYEDNHMIDKRRITLNNELNKHNIPSYTETKSVKGSVFLRTELNTAESPSRKKGKSVTSKSPKTNKDGTLARLDTKVKIVDPKNSKSQPVLPRKETEAIGTIFEPFSGRKEETSIIFFGEQTNLLSPAQHREMTKKTSLGEQSPGFKGKQPTDFLINDRKNEESTTLQNLNKKPPSTFSEATGVRLRVKQIIDKIHQPFEKSQHQNVGEAIMDLLYKLKNQFPTQDLLYSNPPEFVKQLQSTSSSKPSKKYMSRSATFGNRRAKAKKKTRFFPLSQVAMIMNSERESINGNAQRLEIKFTPVIVQAKPSLIILIRDVTEREVIKQMEEKERNQSQALAAVSHEFRTPLNGILGMLDTLKDQITSEIAQDYLMPAYNSAKLLLTLVNDILDFHQLKEQKFTLIPAQFNLRSKVEDCLSLISFQAKRRGLKTQVVIDSGVPKYINNDPNRVQQVINNLLGNAIKFTLEGSITIKVEVYSERTYTIKVIDTGIGIKPENIQKLFKTFGKIDSKENRELNPQGVGLGLTISNSLAEILCTDSRVSGLNVTSEYQKGSTFWFLIDDIPTLSESCEIEDEKEKALFDNMEDLNTRFPEKAISPNKGTSVSQFFSLTMGEKLTELQLPRLRSNLYLSKYTTNTNTNGDVSPNKKIVNTETQLMFNQEAVLKHVVKHFKTTKKESPTVLIVDDNDINHLVFQNFLKNFDMTIESAYNGQQALQRILQRNKNVNVRPYAVVFLDVEMPMMGGIECTHHLRDLMESGEITKFPIIGQSGHENQEEVIKCLEAGMSDYLRKPISKTKLFDIMIKWLGESKI